MIKAIEIESMDECPYIYQTDDGEKYYDRCEKTGGLCVGLESPDCPCNRIRCETCGDENCEKTMHKDTLGKWIEDESHEVTFCSNWQPIEKSK